MVARRLFVLHYYLSGLACIIAHIFVTSFSARLLAGSSRTHSTLLQQKRSDLSYVL